MTDPNGRASELAESITTATSRERVAAYLFDLTNATEWDAHTVACRQRDAGPPRIGTRYEHTRQFRGYRVTTDTEVVEYEPGTAIAWASTTRFGRGTERIVLADAPGGGTEVRHSVQVELQGAARRGQRWVGSVMRRIADDGTARLRQRLRDLDVDVDVDVDPPR